MDYITLPTHAYCLVAVFFIVLFFFLITVLLS